MNAERPIRCYRKDLRSEFKSIKESKLREPPMFSLGFSFFFCKMDTLMKMLAIILRASKERGCCACVTHIL